MKKLALGLSIALLASVASAKDVDWKLDKSHSTIGFVARHLGFAKVRGKFTDFDATIKADDKTGKIKSLNATAKAKSVDTDIEKRDDHLRSDDFFNAAKYPEMKLVSKKVSTKGNKITAVVDLTIRDVTKSVTFSGELLGTHKVNFGGGLQRNAGVELSADINRQDFGLKFNRIAEGVSVVSDTVKIIFEVEMYTKL